MISIHALLAESDVNEIPYQRQIDQFLSTLSLRRATKLIACQSGPPLDFYPRSPCGERPPPSPPKARVLKNFYPRSPCGERRRNRFCPTCQWNFYPRSPCGERHETAWRCAGILAFLSTLSLRRATCLWGLMGGLSYISIHALLAESDIMLAGILPHDADFYPRSPCGERPVLAVLLMFSLYFYPRSPCGERQ